MRILALTASLGAATLLVPLHAHAQDQAPPPEIQRLIDLWSTEASWDVVSPSDLQLPPMRPYRAVYERSYKSASGDTKGQTRNDWYIWQVEQIGWFGDAAYMVSHVDSGNPRWDDATARTHAKVIDGATHALRFGVFPQSGTLADYAVIRSTDTGYQTTVVDTEGEASSSTLATPPVFESLNAELALALMDKHEGQTLRLSYLSTRQNGTYSTPYHVVGRDTMTDAQGTSHEVWVVQTPSTRGRLRLMYVNDQPPYYYGTDIWDPRDDSVNPWHKLKSFTTLPDALDQEARDASERVSSVGQ
ncbi:MAG: hypothetical protein ACF8GE_03465 [Phycisphaerales bacterium JB043]